jgi:alkylated DNA repair protein (DNA oxidative demethylase)
MKGVDDGNASFSMTPDLFDLPDRDVPLADGAVLLRGFAKSVEAPLLAALDEVVTRAPFRHMVTPGGHRMSVAMTNCGAAGWVTDRSG